MKGREQIEHRTDDSLHTRAGRAGEQLKEQLTATLAHELRSPLASILMALQVMRNSRDDEAIAQRARDRAERQAQHMARIIEDVLDISRAGQGKLSLRK